MGVSGSKLSPPAPLSADHDLSDFDCREPALNAWLKERALKNESRFSRSYVVCDGNSVVAYYCISAGSVERSAAPGKVRRNASDAVPVSVIGRLAVDHRYARRGLGADILADALRRVAMAAQTIGIAAVMVQAKDAKAKAFYLACAEFLEWPEGSKTLWLPMDVVVTGLS